MRVIGLAGWSGAGKTTLLVRLIPLFVDRGLRVATLKHAHHGFDVDQPGKDSYKHRAAGASEVLIASARRYALLHELRAGEEEPPLPALLRRLAPADLVLVEGFKQFTHPKVEVHRTANNKPLLYGQAPNIVAIATDAALSGISVPLVDLNNIDGVADLMLGLAQPFDAVLTQLEAAPQPMRIKMRQQG